MTAGDRHGGDDPEVADFEMKVTLDGAIEDKLYELRGRMEEIADEAERCDVCLSAEDAETLSNILHAFADEDAPTERREARRNDAEWWSDELRRRVDDE